MAITGQTALFWVVPTSHWFRNFLIPVVPAPVTWVDSGEAIARRVANLLEEHHSHHEGPVEHRFLYTGSDQSMTSLFPALEAMDFSEIACLDT